MDASERVHSSLGTSPSSFAFSPHFPIMAPKNTDAGAGGGGGGSRNRPVGIPPALPHSRIQIAGSGGGWGGRGGRPPAGQGHARSLSQPPAFFSLDSLPPLSPSTAGPDFAKCNSFRLACGGGEGDSAPPRKAHRRSRSEIPFSFSGGIQSPFGRGGGGFVKPESEWEAGGESVDELFSVYMNLDAIASDDSRASGSRTNGAESSENEADSGVIDSADGPSPESAKRGFDSGARHGRSLSMDSFMGKLPSFGDESPRLPPSPGSNSNTYDLDLGSGNFTAAEMKKIMANEKLVEMAASDPKRVKRYHLLLLLLCISKTYLGFCCVC